MHRRDLLIGAVSAAYLAAGRTHADQLSTDLTETTLGFVGKEVAAALSSYPDAARIAFGVDSLRLNLFWATFRARSADEMRQAIQNSTPAFQDLVKIFFSSRDAIIKSAQEREAQPINAARSVVRGIDRCREILIQQGIPDGEWALAEMIRDCQVFFGSLSLPDLNVEQTGLSAIGNWFCSHDPFSILCSG
ncbi:hypothetical protein ACXHXG_30545 [Rhizobium sp. LEGMi198b]